MALPPHVDCRCIGQPRMDRATYYFHQFSQAPYTHTFCQSCGQSSYLLRRTYFRFHPPSFRLRHSIPDHFFLNEMEENQDRNGAELLSWAAARRDLQSSGCVSRWRQRIPNGHSSRAGWIFSHIFSPFIYWIRGPLAGRHIETMFKFQLTCQIGG